MDCARRTIASRVALAPLGCTIRYASVDQVLSRPIEPTCPAVLWFILTSRTQEIKRQWKKWQAVNKVDLRRTKDTNVHSNAIWMQRAARSLWREVAALICLGCCKFSFGSCFVRLCTFSESAGKYANGRWIIKWILFIQMSCWVSGFFIEKYNWNLYSFDKIIQCCTLHNLHVKSFEKLCEGHIRFFISINVQNQVQCEHNAT